MERISYVEAYNNRSVPVQIAGKQNKLKAGNAIAISDDDVISVYGTEFGGYEAGDNITIEGNVISAEVDTEGLATTEYVDNGLAGKQDYSTLIRRIHIGSAQTPDASLGSDGDLYIYRP